jgi:hypothetical protein
VGADLARGPREACVIVHEHGSSEEWHRLAAEIIVESSSLTDELTDEEASPLLFWGLAQAESAVDAVVATQGVPVGHVRAVLPAADFHAVLAGRLAQVRRMVKAISTLAADRHDLSAQEMVEELEYIRTLAGSLPDIPSLTITDTTLAELAAWQTGFDNAEFVRAILALLYSEPKSEGH